MLPTFFIAGVAKAGTSSMHHYLKQHPSVFMSQTKEPHHFSWEDDGWPTWAVKDRAAYEALFMAATPDQERGEASTWTLYSEGAPYRIAQAIPDAKFIVLLRSPTARAYSNWTFNYGSGFESLDTFEAALEAESERIARGGPWHHHYVRAGLYYKQVRRYIEVFGRNQLLVLEFENFKTNPDQVTRRVLEFLSVNTSFVIDTDIRLNVTYVPKYRWIHEIVEVTNPLKTVVKRFVPEVLRSPLGQKIKTANRVVPPSILPETRYRLDMMFRDDVARLSDLMKHDFLSLWLR